MTEGLLRGRVTVVVRCGHPERVLNLCAERGIALAGSRPLGEDSVELKLDYRGLKTLRALEYDSGFELTVLKKRGLPGLASKLRARAGLLAALTLCIIGLWALSLFAWDFQVYGNESVSTAEILAVMEELGVGPGVCRLTVDDEALANSMLMRITKLSWFAINFSGSRATVLVREESPKPKILEEEVPCDVYSDATGIIERIYVWNGKAAVKAGDAVQEGQLLVSGAMDSISSGVRYEHAAAEIRARTRHVLSSCMELNCGAKTYNGEDERKDALIIGGKRINLYITGGNPGAFYDKIITERSAALPGATLPFKLVKGTGRGYELSGMSVDVGRAEEILKERLRQRLRDEIGESGEILSEKYYASTADGVLTMTLCAHCSQQIGVERETEAEDYIFNAEDNIQNGE